MAAVRTRPNGTVGGAWLWARAQWRLRWRALVVLTVLIGLVAGAALTCLAGARRSASAQRRFRHASLARDAGVQLPGDDDARALVDRILGLPGVLAGTGVDGYPAFIAQGQFDLGIVAPLDGPFGTVVDRPRVLDGRMPRPGRADEVALNPRASSQLRAV